MTEETPARSPQSRTEAYDDSQYLNTQPVEVIADAESQLQTASSGIASAILGALMVIGGVVVLVDAAGLRAASDPLGPAAMPIVIGVALVIVGALLAISNVAPVRDAIRIGVRIERRRIIGVLVLLGAVIGYSVILPFAGFVLTSTLLFVVGALALDAPRRWSLVATGVIIASLIYLLFDRLIGLALPSGPWGF